jgi:hypothetical protein
MSTIQLAILLNIGVIRYNRCFSIAGSAIKPARNEVLGCHGFGHFHRRRRRLEVSINTDHW